MNGEQAITYRRRRDEEVQMWAYHGGTRHQAMQSGLDLLADLKERHPGAAVWLDERRVRAEQPTRGHGETATDDTEMTHSQVPAAPCPGRQQALFR